MNIPKKHHYIPQGFLKRFAFGKKNKKKIFVIFKYQSDNQPKQIAIKNIAYEKKMYDSKYESLEIDFFNKIDSEGISSINKIIKNKQINILNSNEIKNLADFVASLMVRIPQKKRLIHMLNNLNNEIGIEEEKSKEKLQEKFIDDIKFFLNRISTHINKKRITLVENKTEVDFIISDNPVIRHNTADSFTIPADLIKTQPQIALCSIPDLLAIPISPKYLLIFSLPELQIINYVSDKQMINCINDEICFQAEQFIASMKKNLLCMTFQEYKKTCAAIANSFQSEKTKYLSEAILLPPQIELDEHLKKKIKEENFITIRST
jgi:hypothetical protein